MALAAESALDALGDPTRRRILELIGEQPRSITGLSETLPVSRRRLGALKRSLAAA